MKKIIAGLFLAILLLLLGNGIFNINVIANENGPIPSNSEIAASSGKIAGVLAMTKGNNNILNSFFSIKTAHAASLADKINPNHADAAKNQWVFDVWDFCLSLVNIVLIGVLIFLGVVNVLHLNYDTYQLKKILLPLVMAVILANLSLFICRGIVEFSNALSNTFFQDQAQISQGIVNGLHLDKIAAVGAGVGIAALVISWIPIIGQMVGIAGILVPLLIGLIIGLIIFLAFAILAGIMYVRQFIIMILAAVSPLAFIFMVLPATQGLFRKWWDWFLRWVFMGPIILLILKVASIIGISSTSGDDKGALNFFAFIAIIGLMVAAIMVPWLLAGSIMGKLQSGLMKGGGWAGKNVPGIREATAFGKGIYDKHKEDKEKHLALFSAAGRGAMLGAQGKGSVREEWDYEKQKQASEEIGNLIKVSGGVENVAPERLARMQKMNPHAFKQLLNVAGDQGKVTKKLLLNIVAAAELNGLDKNPEEMGKLAGYAQNARDNQKRIYGDNRAQVSDDEDPLNKYSSENKVQENVNSYLTENNTNERKSKAKKVVTELEEMSQKAQEAGNNEKGDNIRNKIREAISQIEREGEKEDFADPKVSSRYNAMKNQHHVDFGEVKKQLNQAHVAGHDTQIQELLSERLTAGEFQQGDAYHQAHQAMNGKDLNQILNDANVGGDQRQILIRNWNHNKQLIDAANVQVANQTSASAGPLPANNPPPSNLPSASRTPQSTLQTNRTIPMPPNTP